MSTQTQDSPSTELKKSRKVAIADFGSGRYSPAMKELFNDTQRLLGFSNIQAHVTAARLGIDAGQLQSEQVKLSYGRKTNKDGLRTLKEISKGLKIRNTWAMSIAAICCQLDETRGQGLVVEKCTLVKELLDAVERASEGVSAME